MLKGHSLNYRKTKQNNNTQKRQRVLEIEYSSTYVKMLPCYFHAHLLSTGGLLALPCPYNTQLVVHHTRVINRPSLLVSSMRIKYEIKLNSACLQWYGHLISLGILTKKGNPLLDNVKLEGLWLTHSSSQKWMDIIITLLIHLSPCS